jgi:hypothetical protein
VTRSSTRLGTNRYSGDFGSDTAFPLGLVDHAGSVPEIGPTVVKHLQLMLNQRGGPRAQDQSLRADRYGPAKRAQQAKKTARWSAWVR